MCPCVTMQTDSRQVLNMQRVHERKVTKSSTLRADRTHTNTVECAVATHYTPIMQCTKEIEEVLADGKNSHKLVGDGETAVVKFLKFD